jgi:SagB-type dehydrogenase family enzyme
MISEPIRLPKPSLTGGLPLADALARRRSVRSFLPKELTMKQISQLLWAGQGLTSDMLSFRTAPSAGGLFPLQLYVLKKEGCYRYSTEEHALHCLGKADKRPLLARACHNQSFIAEAPLLIVIVGNPDRLNRYGPRAARYLQIEVGHVAQNIHLQAIALGLASVPIGAFQDDMVAKQLELPPEIKPFYLIPVGCPRPKSE